MAEPCTHLLLFGATGDLARRMLLPSLFNLDAEGLLPSCLRIVATARTGHDDAAYRDLAAGALAKVIEPERLAEPALERFLERLRYVPLDATTLTGFAALGDAVPDKANLAIFLSTAPALFGPTIAGLESAGLAGPGARLALEKPLGDSLAASRDINDAVAGAYTDGIRAGWAATGMTPRPYAAGTWGPNAAIALTERDGVSWHD